MLQRLTAEAKLENLASPKFAGNDRLERAFDNSPAIHIGESGEAVRLVQEALADEGFAMPKSTKPTGELDGGFGQETLDIISEFQAEHGLAVDGIVGRETLGQLDRLQGGKPERSETDQPPSSETPEPPAEPPPPTAGQPTAPAGPTEQPPAPESPGEPEQSSQCLTVEEIEGVLAGEEVTGSSRDGAFGPVPTGVFSFGPTGAFSFGPTAGADRNLGIEGAVEAFKKRLDVKAMPTSGRNISASGQFFFRDTVRTLVEQELRRVRGLGAEDDDVGAFVVDGLAAIDPENIRDDEGFNQRVTRMGEAKARVSAKGASSELKKSMEALLAQHSAGGLHFKWWREIEKTDRAPDFMPFRSVRLVKALDKLEKTGCSEYVTEVAKRIRAKRVSEGQESKRVFSGRSIAKPSAKRDLRKGPTGGMLGDVVEQTDVARAVDDVRNAIQAGEMVHARVLSGVGVGTPKATVPFDPPETKPRTVTLDTFGEHSILIIGFEGDTFVFHDPDASSSSTPERGFGFLVHDQVERRLSTAFIDNDFPVDGDGDHRRGDHRYQVTQLNQI